MARSFPVDASDSDLRAAVVEWSELLARGEYAAALSMFDLPSGPYDEDWTPELLERTIATYGCPTYADPEGRTYRVTSLYELADVTAREYVTRKIDVDRENLYGLDAAAYLGMIHYEGVPLNGEPSDLTARFRIKKAGAGIALEFQDIHVM